MVVLHQRKKTFGGKAGGVVLKMCCLKEARSVMYALVTITAVNIILGAMVPLPLHKLLTDPQCLAFSYSVLL